MPKVTLSYADETAIPAELKAFKTADNKIDVWVNTDQDAVAAELNPSLAANRDSIKGEKETIETKYKALVSTSSQDDVITAKRIADLEAKVTNPIPEQDKKLLDAIKTAKADATPEFISEAIKEYPIVTEKLTAISAEKTNDALFAASGYKNRIVFDTVFNNDALNPNRDSVVWKDEKDAQNNVVKVPYIKVKNAVDGKVELPFADYTKVTPEWSGFIPSLNNGGQQTQQWNPVEQSQQFQNQQFNATNPTGLPTNNFLDAIETGQKAQADAGSKAKSDQK